VALVGDGNLRGELEKRAQELKIGDRVKFVGLVQNDKIPDCLAAADLYATCSRSDSASLGLLEAMAMGLPTVASDIPANREWIADGQSGWLFPVGNAEGLAKALRRAMADEKDRAEVAMRGRAIVLARADARKNFPRLLARIEGLARARR
jgi:glycosyltransferase involved in cell wall biosynthesis